MDGFLSLEYHWLSPATNQAFLFGLLIIHLMVGRHHDNPKQPKQWISESNFPLLRLNTIKYLIKMRLWIAHTFYDINRHVYEPYYNFSFVITLYRWYYMYHSTYRCCVSYVFFFWVVVVVVFRRGLSLIWLSILLVSLRWFRAKQSRSIINQSQHIYEQTSTALPNGYLPSNFVGESGTFFEWYSAHGVYAWNKRWFTRALFVFHHQWHQHWVMERKQQWICCLY